MALRLILDHLVYAERQDEAWTEERQAMESRGTLTSIGVTGAFRALVPGDYEYGVASVYAEFVRARGWLEADRVFTADEHESMRQKLSTWVAQDRVLSEVLETFGPPSVLFGGNNPLYGKTLGYLTGQAKEPMLFFHPETQVDVVRARIPSFPADPGPTQARCPFSRGKLSLYGSTRAFLRPRWLSVPGTVWTCSFASTPSASRGRKRVPTGRSPKLWRHETGLHRKGGEQPNPLIRLLLLFGHARDTQVSRSDIHQLP
ncbi:hypothetical protein [Streptosporangium sp. NPDC004631]